MLDVTRYIKAKNATPKPAVKLVKLGPTVAAVFTKFDPDTGEQTFEEKQEFTVDELSQNVTSLTSQKSSTDANFDTQIANTRTAISDAQAVVDSALEEEEE